jgi:putative transcriptional regulator
MERAMKEKILNEVKERRNARGMTQEDLARQAGVSRQSVISIERGRYVPSLPLALRLARIFACTTDELFRLEEDR